MRANKRDNSNLLKKYNKKRKISSLLWLVAGAAVLGFGIYYREIFEIVFGALAVIYAIYNHKTRVASLSGVARIERNKLSFLALCIVIFSLVNPIGNIPVIYDLFKRDETVRGGFDEKEI